MLDPSSEFFKLIYCSLSEIVLYVLRNYLWILNEEELVESNGESGPGIHTQDSSAAGDAVVDLCSLADWFFWTKSGC